MYLETEWKGGKELERILFCSEFCCQLSVNSPNRIVIKKAGFHQIQFFVAHLFIL